MTKRKQYPWELPAAIERRLGPQSYGRQRVIAEGSDVLIILHAVPPPDQRFPEERVFWRQADGTLLANGRTSGEKMLRQCLKEFDEAYDHSRGTLRGDRIGDRSL